MKDAQPWWVAKDICDVLDIKNPASTLALLDEDEKMTVTTNDGHSGQRGGAQFQAIVNEPGMYSLVLKSRLTPPQTSARYS